MQLISQDILKDIIQYTFGLGVVQLVKITGDGKTITQLDSLSDDRSVILTGKFKEPIVEFTGVFGMPNLVKLKTILGFTEEYNADSTVTVTTQPDANGLAVPATLHFANKAADFVNDYRLMSKSIVEEKIKQSSLIPPTWQVSFDAGIVGIQRLKKQASVHNEESSFTTYIDNGNLMVKFGNVATHHSSFMFHQAPTGTFKESVSWPVKEFLSIMDLPGTKHVQIVGRGLMKISIDSGITEYEYYIPAWTK